MAKGRLALHLEELGERLESLESEVTRLRKEVHRLEQASLHARTIDDGSIEHDVLRARKLEIVDDAGIARACIEADRKGASIELLGHDGVPRVRMSAPDGRGPSVVLMDEEGLPRVSLHAEGVGQWQVAEGGEEEQLPWAMLMASAAQGIGPGVAVWDPAGRPRLALVVTDEGPGIYLSGEGDDPAKDSLILQVSSEGPSAAFHDGQGIPRMGLGVRPDEGPFLTVVDALGNARIVLQEQGDRASLELFDGNEDQRLVLVCNAAGDFSQLVAFGPTGEVAMAVGVSGPDVGLEVYEPTPSTEAAAGPSRLATAKPQAK